MREKIYQIIFESDTKLGKAFDVTLIGIIMASVLVVCLESIEQYHASYGVILNQFEWFFTIFFTIDYLLRVYSIEKPTKYIFSFFGIVDLLAILPVFIGFFVSGAESLVVIRAIRILRIFRLLKLTRYVGEGEVLAQALIASKHKITVFLTVVLTIVVFMGAVMYLVEGKEHGFDNIPKSMYWAIVTMTTVGYGDLVPKTGLGKFLSSCLMIMGYAIIAVPTGIVTAELTSPRIKKTKQRCPSCEKFILNRDYSFCPYCQESLT